MCVGGGGGHYFPDTYLEPTSLIIGIQSPSKIDSLKTLMHGLFSVPSKKDCSFEDYPNILNFVYPKYRVEISYSESVHTTLQEDP